MIGDYKEVYFHEYCKTCKHRDIEDWKDPCNPCRPWWCYQNMSSLDVIDGKWYAAAVVIISMGLLIA